VEEDESFVKDLEEAWESFLDDVEEAIRKSAFGYIKETKEEKLTYQGEVIQCKKETYYPPNTTSLKLIAEAKMRGRGYGRKQSEDKGGGYGRKQSEDKGGGDGFEGFTYLFPSLRYILKLRGKYPNL